MAKRYYDSERNRYDYDPVAARRQNNINVKPDGDPTAAKINRSESDRQFRRTLLLYSTFTALFGILWSWILYDPGHSERGFLAWFFANWLTVVFLALLSAALVTVWARFGSRHNWNSRSPRM